MPLTLPAHAAAVLPFARWSPRWVHPTALVVGACAPDLGYLFGVPGSVSHRLSGLPLVVVIGALFFGWTELLILPAAAPLLPSWFGIQWSIALRPNPALRQGGSCLFKIGLGIAVGALTHLLWDGVTHHGWWPGAAIMPDPRVNWIASRPRVTEVLWVSSTVLGSGAVWIFLRKYFPAPLLSFRAEPHFLFLLLLVIAAAASGRWFGMNGPWENKLIERWNGTIYAVGAAFLAASGWSFWRRLRAQTH